MWELDCEEGWPLKNWCFWTVVLEKTLEGPLDCKEIQSVHSEGDQPWDFFGRNDAKAETPELWPPHEKNWLIGKDPDAGRDWGQEEKGTTEDEMAGRHHWLDGRESEWAPGVGDGKGGLVCCDSWGCKESDTTKRLIWSDLIWWTRSDYDIVGLHITAYKLALFLFHLIRGPALVHTHSSVCISQGVKVNHMCLCQERTTKTINHLLEGKKSMCLLHLC